jgi:hypothetical protein
MMIEVHWSWLLAVLLLAAIGATVVVAAVLLLAAIGATVVVALIWETFENRKIKRRWRNHD